MAGRARLRAQRYRRAEYDSQLRHGGQALALQKLSGSSPTLYAQGWVKVASQSTAVPMSSFQLGDDSTGRTYSWYADDLTVATVQPGF